MFPEFRAPISGLAWAHLGQSWAGLFAVPISGPRVCCLPCLSLDCASVSMGRVWQTQSVPISEHGEMVRVMLIPHLGSARKHQPEVRKHLKINTSISNWRGKMHPTFVHKSHMCFINYRSSRRDFWCSKPIKTFLSCNSSGIMKSWPQTPKTYWKDESKAR